MEAARELALLLADLRRAGSKDEWFYGWSACAMAEREMVGQDWDAVIQGDLMCVCVVSVADDRAADLVSL